MRKFEGMLLACDMDGTLLDSDRCISPENLQAIHYFVNEDVYKRQGYDR